VVPNEAGSHARDARPLRVVAVAGADVIALEAAAVDTGESGSGAVHGRKTSPRSRDLKIRRHV
jgi:hypothetical protein